MGFALASAAVSHGAEVVLVAGPVYQPTPPGVTQVDVRSAAQMRDAVLSAFLRMFTSVQLRWPITHLNRCLPQKIKKSGQTLILELVRTKTFCQRWRRRRLT